MTRLRWSIGFAEACTPRPVRSGLFLAFLLYVTLDLLTPFLPGIFQFRPDESREAVVAKRAAPAEINAIASTLGRDSRRFALADRDDGGRTVLRHAAGAPRIDELRAGLPRRDCRHDADPTPDDHHVLPAPSRPV